MFAARVVAFNQKLKEAAEVTQGLLYLRVKGLHFDTPAMAASRWMGSTSMTRVLSN